MVTGKEQEDALDLLIKLATPILTQISEANALTTWTQRFTSRLTKALKFKKGITLSADDVLNLAKLLTVLGNKKW